MDISLCSLLPWQREGKRWFLCNKLQQRAFHGSIRRKCLAVPGQKSIFLAWLSPVENRPQPLWCHALSNRVYLSWTVQQVVQSGSARHISVCVFYMYLWSQLCWVFQTHGYLIYNILKWYTMDAQNKNGANLKDSVLSARTNKKKQLTAARKACLQSQCLRLDDVLSLWNNPLE